MITQYLAIKALTSDYVLLRLEIITIYIHLLSNYSMIKFK